jgi:hypothetical protein
MVHGWIYRMVTIWPQHFKYTQNIDYTWQREFICFTWMNDSSSSTHLNMSAICRPQKVQIVLDFTSYVFQHLESDRSNCIVDSCTKFNHTTKFGTKYLVFYVTCPHKRIQWGYIVRTRRPRDWSVPPNSSVCKLLFRLLTVRQQCWGTLLLKENVWLKVCHLWDCK